MFQKNDNVEKIQNQIEKINSNETSDENKKLKEPSQTPSDVFYGKVISENETLYKYKSFPNLRQITLKGCPSSDIFKDKEFPKLDKLIITKNFILHEIPESIGNLTNLKELYIDFESFYEFNIDDDEFFDYDSEYDYETIGIPSSIGNLIKL